MRRHLIILLASLCVSSLLYGEYQPAEIRSVDFAGGLFSATYLDGFHVIPAMNDIFRYAGASHYYQGFCKRYREGDASIERDFWYYALIFEGRENFDREPYRYFEQKPGRFELERVNEKRNFTIASPVDREAARFLAGSHALRKTIREYLCDIYYGRDPLVWSRSIMDCALIELPAGSNIRFQNQRIRAIAVCFPYFTKGYTADGYRSQFRSVIEAFNFKDIAALIQAEKDRLAAEEQKRKDAMQKVKETEDQRKQDEKTKVKPGVGAGTVTAPVIKK